MTGDEWQMASVGRRMNPALGGLRATKSTEVDQVRCEVMLLQTGIALEPSLVH